MNKNEGLAQAIKFFGNQTIMANILGVTDAAVSQWVAEGEMPPKRAMQIEQLTKGEIKAFDLVVTIKY